MLVNGYALNHTALSVHSIAGRSGDIYAFADELVAKGFRMNEAGGIMKVRGSLAPACAVLCRHRASMLCSWRSVGALVRRALLPPAAQVYPMLVAPPQVSPDSGLLQCATVADVVPFTFADGEVRVFGVEDLPCGVSCGCGVCVVPSCIAPD